MGETIRLTSVLVEGECWESTLNRANQVLHLLGFPPCGLSKVSMENAITVTTTVAYDGKELMDNMRAAALEDNLVSYEEAVCENDSDDMDMAH